MKSRSKAGIAGFVTLIAVVGAMFLTACDAPAAVLSGQLRSSETGRSAPGVQVSVYSSTSEDVVAQTVTDESGTYRFTSGSLPDGTYRLRFSDSDWFYHAADWSTAANVPVSASNPAHISESLRPASGSVSGMVTSSGHPLQRAAVTAFSTTNHVQVQSTVTLASGEYTFSALPTGTYYLEFSSTFLATRYSGDATSAESASTITVTNGSESTDVDASLPAGSVIRGSVTTAGIADGGLRISAYPVGSATAVSETTSGSDGKFSLVGLSAVPYLVEVSDPTNQLRTTFWHATSAEPLGVVLTPPAGASLDSGTQSMVGRDCDPSRYAPGIDLSGKDLTGLDLTACDLAGDNLTNADLTGTNLTGATLTNATITGVDLTGTVLNGITTGSLVGAPAHLPPDWLMTEGYLVGPGADLRDADLAGADLSGATLTGTNLEGADLSNADLTGADLTDADILDADLRGATLSGLVTKETVGPPAALPSGWIYVRFNMPKGYLVGPGADLAGADLSDQAVTGADLRDTDLSNADLSGTIFTNVDLSGADLSGSTLTGATLAGANLADVDLTGVSSGSILGQPVALPTNWWLVEGTLIGPGAHLAGDDLSNLDLTGAHLSGADLSGADLTATDLTGADLSNADLSRTDLTDVEITAADITSADLTGATTRGVISGSLVGSPHCVTPTTACVVRGYLLEPGVHLVGVNFSGASLGDVDLTGADLTDALFVGATIDYPPSHLDGANLSGADFTNATLDSVSLTGANLSGTKFGGASLSRVSSGAISTTPTGLPSSWKLVSGYLVGPTAVLDGANLSGADLSGLDLNGASFNSANLTGADLAGAELNATMYSANLSGADLSGANLFRVTLGGARLTGATITGADFTQGDLSEVRSGALVGAPAVLPSNWRLASGYLVGPTANLSADDLTGVDFTSADLEQADLRGSDLSNATLHGASLSGASFTGAVLTGADLTGATLTSAWFDHADLTGADLTGAGLWMVNLEQTNLSGATLTGVASGAVFGVPTALPDNWSLSGGYLIGPGANLFQADLDGVDLAGLDLEGSNLTLATLIGANLAGANLTNTNLDKTDLTGATLNGVISGGITGTPKALPVGWSLVGGELVPTAP